MLLQINPLEYRGNLFVQIIPLKFINHLRDKMRRINGARWERETGWYIPRSRESYQQLLAIFGESNIRIDKRPVCLIDEPEPVLNEAQQRALEAIETQLMVNRYSRHTKKNYLYYFRLFIVHFESSDLDTISNEEIKQFLLEQLKARNWSESAQNTCINAIKFYYEKVLGRERTFYELRAKKRHVLPTILSEDEIKRLFQAVDNLKHKCILMLIYSAGLRLSESVNLLLDDIMPDTRQIFVRGGKGKKDRYTVLSQKAMQYLQTYIEQHRPRRWVFEGWAGEQYSVRSVQSILKRAVEKSGVNRYTTVHTLRHSFATHLLDNGMALRHIQYLLGHDSIKTTERYLHITDSAKHKLKSPLDELDL